MRPFCMPASLRFLLFFCIYTNLNCSSRCTTVRATSGLFGNRYNELSDAISLKKACPFSPLEMSAETCFEYLASCGLSAVLSIEEVGLEVTYKRDRFLKTYFDRHQISWTEFPYSGIRRGLSNRKNFNAYWYDYMSNVIPIISWEAFLTPPASVLERLNGLPRMGEKPIVPGIVQVGGSEKSVAIPNEFYSNTGFFIYAAYFKARTGEKQLQSYQSLFSLG